MTSRAAILPYPCDPFLLNYWLKFYDNVWGDEVDQLYIYANSAAEDEVWDYIKDRVSRSKNVTLIIDPQQREHGYCIDKALDVIVEQYVMLIEDDCFVFKKGYISQCFEQLEQGTADIVGSKRGSCSFEILDRAKELYNLNYEGLGDQGCNFWPNLFFTKTDILRNTSRQFGSKHWIAGEYCEWLNYTFKEEAAGDTFVGTSLELRAMISKGKIAYIPQYHASPDDIRDYEAGRFLFDGQAPWVHMGSLSSGVGGLIRDEFNRPLTKRHMPKEEPVLPSHCNTEGERWEFERRVCSWQMCLEEREAGHLDRFAQEYQAGLERIITQFGLNKGNIKRRKAIYKQLGL